MVTTVDTGRAQELLDAGAQVIEVLPESAWRSEHLPGARSIPLPQLRADALDGLDRAAPTVVYCYDHECDLSGRGAARLVALGFAHVYDFAGSKTAWLGAGLPVEGDVLAQDRAGARAHDPPTCGPQATIAEIAAELAAADPVLIVVNADGIVLGALHSGAATLPGGTPVLAAADPAPPSVRPSITRHELARSMDDGGQHHVVVSTSQGRLLGVVRRGDLG